MIKRFGPLKYCVLIMVVFSFVLFTLSFTAFGIKPFPIKEYVTDNAGILSETVRVQLANQLSEYTKQTGNQILVVTIPGLDGEDYIDFTERLFQLNKPGQKGKDNGIMLLVALKERQVRIEVGYGLEEQVPDGKAGAIYREQITPYFKAGDYNSGIAAGVYALITAITPNYALPTNQLPETPVRHQRDRSFPVALIVGLLFLVFSLFGGMRSSRSNQRRFRRGYSEPWFWGGGGFGGGSSSGGGGSDSGFSGGGGDFGGGGSGGSW